MSMLLAITLLAPLAGVLALLVAPRDAQASHFRRLAALAAAVALGGATGLFVTYDRALGGMQFAWSSGGLRAMGLNLSFGLDGMSLPLLVMSACVGVAAILAGGNRPRAREFYVLLLLTLGASLAAFSSRNLFYFYFFCEITTLPKYLLIAIWGRLPDRAEGATPGWAAMQVTLFIAAGAMALLIGFALLYTAAGSFDQTYLVGRAVTDPIATHTQIVIYGCLLLGFGVWSSLWPLHAWTPLAYAAAPAPGAMLFAGVLKNFGAYGLLRIGCEILPEGARHWALPLALLAMVNILYAGLAAMQQKDWARIVAYSGISHVGFLFLAIASGSALGIKAAILFMVVHGLVTAVMFIMAEWLWEGAGSRLLPDLGGLARALPATAIVATAAVIAASGLPGFGNFVAELMVFFAAWGHGGWVFRLAAVVAVWGIVITATYLFRALRTTFHGEPRTAPVTWRPATPALVAAGLLLVVSMAIGCWPRLVTDLWGRSADAAARVAAGPPADSAGGPASLPAGHINALPEVHK